MQILITMKSNANSYSRTNQVCWSKIKERVRGKFEFEIQIPNQMA